MKNSAASFSNMIHFGGLVLRTILNQRINNRTSSLVSISVFTENFFHRADKWYEHKPDYLWQTELSNILFYSSEIDF